MALWNSGDSLSPSMLNLKAGLPGSPVGLSSNTLIAESGSTIKVLSNLSSTGAVISSGSARFGGSVLSSHNAAETLVANSTLADYLYLEDSSNQRSSYVIGSKAGGTLDGLNIYDSSGATTIVSFSKESTRFYGPVVGPVFDTGGALASTYNAALFLPGGSKESRIQAAINAASTDSIARVYVPASMYPYNAAIISFSSRVQMVREGGEWTTYDLQAYGAGAGNAASDTAAFNATITGSLVPNASGDVGGGQIVEIPPLRIGLTYHLSSTVTIGNGHALYVRGHNSAGFLDSVEFVWDGANGGTAFYVNRCRDSTFEGFSVIPGTGTLAIGLDVDQSGTPTGGTDISTNLTFRRLHVKGGFSTAGIRLTGGGNNDLHVFEDVTIANYGGEDAAHTPAVALLIDNGQSKMHQIRGGTFSYCRTAAINCNAGSFMAFGTNFSLNSVDVQLGSPTDVIGIYGAQSESAGRFLAASTPTPVGWAVSVFNSRLDTNAVAGDNIYFDYEKRGPLNLIGNDFASGVNRPSVVFKGNPNGGAQTFINLVGNIFPGNTNIFVPIVPSILYRVAGHGNVYVDGSGISQPFIIGDLVSQTLTDAATVAVDATLGELCTVTLGGNRTVGAPTNPYQGGRLSFIIIQDGTGGRTLAWNAIFKVAWSNAGNVAGKRTMISFIFDGTNWNQDGAQTPYV